MKSASPDIKIEIGILGGSPEAYEYTDITALVMSDIELGDRGIFVEATTYGMTAESEMAVGMTAKQELNLEMFFDDAANGAADIFKTISGPNTPVYRLRRTLTAGSPASIQEVDFVLKENPIRTMVKGVTKMIVKIGTVGPVTLTLAGA